MAQTQAVCYTHFPNELLDGLVDGISAEVELGGNLPGLVGECHAAFWFGVEGADEFDLLGWLGAGLGLLEDYGVAEREGRRLIASEDA